MAHGTGTYMIRNYKADIETEEYGAYFTQARYYYYEQMSDCYEPTWENKDEYEVTVYKWRTDRYGDQVIDGACEGVRTGSIDKDTVNKIWWNLKNQKISYKTVERYFTELAGRKIDAHGGSISDGEDGQDFGRSDQKTRSVSEL